MSTIAVLIPHYNDIRGLMQTLDSISDTEPVDVVIVDDGSQTKPNLEKLRNKYHKINVNVIFLEVNAGIEIALNAGIEYIKGIEEYELIARLDCGDICTYDRFKVQKEFMNQHADIALVSSYVTAIDINGNEQFTYKPPTSHKEIQKRMYITSCFVHTAVMFRTNILDDIGYYPLNYKAAEDYAYFFRIVKRLRTANISKVLVKYEINPNGISVTKRKQQLNSTIRVILDNFEYRYAIYACMGIVKAAIYLCLGGVGFVNQIKKKVYQKSNIYHI